MSDLPSESGTLELTCQRCGEVYVCDLPFTKENLPMCGRCFLIDGESMMTYRRIDGASLTVKATEYPSKADLRFIAKEAILIAIAAGICCVHFLQRQTPVVSLLFGVMAGGFASVAIVAGLKYWYRRP